MFIGISVLLVAAVIGIAGTVVSTARDGYGRVRTRNFD